MLHLHTTSTSDFPSHATKNLSSHTRESIENAHRTHNLSSKAQTKKIIFPQRNEKKSSAKAKILATGPGLKHSVSQMLMHF